MAKHQKFLFEVDFGPKPRPKPAEVVAAEEEIAVAMEPQIQMFTEDEVSLVRTQAYEAGRQAGLHEGEATSERLLAMALAAIGGELQGLAAAQEAANEAMLRGAVGVAMVVVRKLLPEMARRHAIEEVTAVVEQCLSHIDTSVRVTIRVNPMQLDDVRTGIGTSAFAQDFEGHLNFVGDPRVAAGDCRVDWGDGGAARDQASLWAEIDGIVARALGEDPDQDAGVTAA